MSSLYFGQDAKGEHIGLPLRRLREHCLIVGSTGSGKTTFLESIARQIIERGHPLIFLDPKGTVYHRLVNYCRREGITDRLHLIDPNDNRYRVGLNYFDIAAISASQKIGLVKQAIYRAMGQTSEDLKITFERWGTAALSLLADAQLTLADFHTLLTDETLREAALQLNKNPQTLQEWQDFAHMRPREQDQNLAASINRASLFTNEPTLYQITGLPTAIDWQEVMNNRGIVLVNLAPQNTTQQLCHFLGLILVHQIYHAGLRRPQKHWSQPCFLIADEFAKVICPDFKEILQEMREFGVSTLLALLNLEDLRGIDPNNPDAMLRSVSNQTLTKFIMRMNDPKQAQDLARSLFGPHITGMEVKHTQTSAIPHTYEKEVISETQSTTSSGGYGYAAGAGQSEATQIIGLNGITRITGDSQQTIDSWAEGSADTYGATKTTQQRIDYEYEKIPTYRPVDESLHLATGDIVKLDVGYGYLNYTNKRPPTLIHAYKSYEYHEDPQAIADYTAAIFERMGAFTPEDATRYIEERRRLLLVAPAKTPTPLRPEHMTDPDDEAN